MANQGDRSLDSLQPNRIPAVASLGPLSPRLRELVDDDTGSILSKAGYLSSRTIGNLWDDSDEAALALALLGIPESLAISLYNGCDSICCNLVDDITRHGLIAVLAVTNPGALVVAPIPVTPFQAIASAVSNALFIEKSKLAKSKATQSAADLWNILINAGDASKIFKDASSLSPKLQVAFRRHQLARWVDIPAPSLRGYIMSFQRFSVWCRSHGVDPFHATRPIFVLYFGELQEGKATVSQNHHRRLSWIGIHFELPWDLNSKSIVDAASVRSSHVESQISPMRISMWAILALLSTSGNIIVKGVALFWIIIIQGVIRPKHLQCSKIICLHPHSIEGKASLGKVKTFGRRRPFAWRCPREDILSTDMGSRAMEFLQHSGESDREFFMPDTSPDGVGFNGKSFKNSPMSQSKLKQLTFCILEAVGISPQTIAQLNGFYAGRRLLPTLAHRLKFQPGERLDVGAWSGGKTLAMPQKYSEAKLDEQSSLRSELIAHASGALRNIMIQHPSPAEDLEVTLSYTNIWRHFNPRGSNKQKPTDVPSVAKWLSSMFPKMANLECAYSAVTILKSGSSGSSSSSSSSSPSKASKSSDCIEEEPGADIQWQLSQGKKGCLHLVIGDAGLRCGRNLRHPELGLGLKDALATGKDWSPRCKAALLDDEKKWWADAHRPSPA